MCSSQVVAADLTVAILFLVNPFSMNNFLCVYFLRLAPLPSFLSSLTSSFWSEVLSKWIPNLKVLVMVREPTARAWSEYKFFKKPGTLSPRDFHTGLVSPVFLFVLLGCLLVCLFVYLFVCLFLLRGELGGGGERERERERGRERGGERE